jgi:hypothetical protein
MSAGGMLTIAVVLGLLFVISIPRLRSFARNENERDARIASLLIASELADLPDLPHGTDLPPIEDLAAPLRHRLPASEFL